MVTTATATATRRPRLTRTESQKKRTAAKAAETRARNKAAKAIQNGQGPGVVQPNDASTSTVNPQPPQIPQVRPESTLSGNLDNGLDIHIDPSLRTLQAPTTQAPRPTPPTEQDPLSHAHGTHSSTFMQHQRSPSPTYDLDGGDPRPSSSTAVSSLGSLSSTMTSSRTSPGPSSNSSRSAPSRRTQEKKLIPYRTYDPKEALGLAGRENKERWLLLRETVRGLLKAQRFQAAQSWTKHTLAQRAVVVIEAQKELARKVVADPEWTRVISHPLLPQVIEDVAKDCCNNIKSYKSQKQKNNGRTG